MLPTAVLLIIACLARVTLGTWFAPAAFFAATWFGYTTISLLFSPWAALDPGLWWMAASIFCVYLGNLVAQLPATRPLPRKAAPVWIAPFPHLERIVVACLIGAIVYVALAPTLAYDLKAPLESPPTRLFNFTLSFVYALCMFNGALFAVATRRSQIVLALTHFPLAAFMGIESGGRSALMSATIFWLSSWFSVSALRNRGKVRLLTLRIACIIPLVPVLIMFNMIVPTIVRMNAVELSFTDRSAGWRALLELTTEENVERSIRGLQSSTIGQVASFTWWLEREWQSDWDVDPRVWVGIFSAPLDVLGLADRLALSREGLFESQSFDDQTMSNVYTIFRPLIGLFTLPGSLIALFGLGVVGGWAHRRVAAGDARAVIVLVNMYVNTMVPGGIWWGYNSVVLAYLFLAAYLFWVTSIERRRWRHVRQNGYRPFRHSAHKLSQQRQISDS